VWRRSEIQIFAGTGWNLGLVAGLIFADQRYNCYFYNVDSAYATPTRSAYSAHGGYSGGQFIVALSKRYPTFWVAGFTKLDTLNGVVFSDSPLVEKKLNYSIGIAISWIFGQSKVIVKKE
jgi:outer membrane scaffolding protein for murein synthesis (MipA/OmpV family)